MKLTLSLLLSFLSIYNLHAQLVLDAIAHDPFSDTNLKITAIEEDSEGNIWVCGDDGNIAWYDGNTWNKFVVPDFEDTDFLTIELDENDRIWLGGIFETLEQTDTTWTRYSVNANPAFNSVSEIYKAPDGTVWMGGITSLIRIQNGDIDTYTQFNSELQGFDVRNIFPAGNNSIWYTAQEFLTKTDGESSWETSDLFDVINEIPPPATRDMDVDANGNFWMATSRGLIRYDGSNFSEFSSTLGQTSYRAIGVDAAGVVWLGKSGFGLERLAGNQVLSFQADGITVPAENITAIHVDANDDKWVAGETGGIMQIKGLKTSVKVLEQSDPIKVFPTISNGLVQVSGLDEEAQILVFDVLGKPIEAFKSRGNTTSLDLSALPNGWYILQMRNQTDIYSQKVGIFR